MMIFLNNATMFRIVLSAAKQGRKMKILKNEDEYRRWIIEDHFHMEDAERALSYEPDIQRTLSILHPREFPCLAYTENISRMSNNHEIRYIYQDEFENILSSLA